MGSIGAFVLGGYVAPIVISTIMLIAAAVAGEGRALVRAAFC